MRETPRFTRIAVYWYKFVHTQKCNHRTLKTTSSRTAKTLVLLLRKQRGWDKELHCYRPKNGRHVSWRSFINIFTHGFLMFQGRSENWFFVHFQSNFKHVDLQHILIFPHHFLNPKNKILSEGLRLLDLPWWVSLRLCDLALLGRGNFQSWSSFRWVMGITSILLRWQFWYYT